MSNRMLLAALPFIALAACSSAPENPVGAIPAPFAKYCTGTLKVDRQLMTPMPPGGWTSDRTTASAGSKFVLSPSFGHWEGYVFREDGAAAKISTSHSIGLVKDTDFTSDCAIDTSSSGSSDSRRTVLFAKATIFVDKNLGGSSCTLESGTELTKFDYAGGFSGPGTLSSAEVKAKCGWDTGYSNDILYAYVLVK